MSERYRPLIFGPWQREQIRVIWEDRLHSLPDFFHDDIETRWRQGEQDGHYNGRMARLERWSINNKHLTLYLSTTDYKTLLFSNANIDRLLTTGGPQSAANALGVSALVRSRDGVLLLMQRSASVGEYPDGVDLFGGHIDEKWRNLSEPLFHAMEQELLEELALPSSEYHLSCLGMIEAADHYKPELVFLAECARDADALMQAGVHARDRFEYTKIILLPDDKPLIENFTACEATLTPSAYGCLKTYSHYLEKSHERSNQTTPSSSSPSAAATTQDR